MECVDEQTVLPHLSLQSVQEWLRHRFAKEGDAKSYAKADDLALQYFSRFLKMGVAQSDLDLSDNYAVWDSDVILLRSFCPFNSLGQAVLMEGDGVQSGQCHQFDKLALRQMTGVDYAYSRSKKPFNAYQAVVGKQLMKEFLQEVEKNNPQHHWSINILEGACKTMAACECGFSEYGWYTSWLKHKQANNQFEEVQPLYRHYSPAMILQDDNELIAGLISGTVSPGTRPPCCPQALYDMSGFWGNRDIGEGHQFVRFTRECPTKVINKVRGDRFLADIARQHSGPKPPQLNLALDVKGAHVQVGVNPHAAGPKK